MLFNTSYALPELFTHERLNGVNRQPSNGQKFNRQSSKKGKFYNRQKAVVISRQMVSQIIARTIDANVAQRSVL